MRSKREGRTRPDAAQMKHFLLLVTINSINTSERVPYLDHVQTRFGFKPRPQ
jgi:hypothetical protein